MKLFITGGGGFIGRSLQKHLKHTKYMILAPTHKELDISDEVSVDDFMNKHNPDIIIHTANQGGGRNTVGLDNIIPYNLRMFFNIAKQAPKVQKIIHLGSGAEYGKHKPVINVKEDEALQQLPIDDYGFYKSICSRYIEQTDNIINLRIFGCYGELEDYRYKFISNAIIKNILGLPITIHQNVLFDYIYIDDLIKIVLHTLTHDMKYPIYNASTGQKISILDLAHIIDEVGPNNVPINILNDGMNLEYTSNNDRIKQEIPDLIFTSHQEGIKQLFSYFQENLDTIDIETVKRDPYLKKCHTIWKPTS